MRIASTIIINHVLWWQMHSLADSAGDMLRQSSSQQSAVPGVRIGFTTSRGMKPENSRSGDTGEKTHFRPKRSVFRVSEEAPFPIAIEF